MEIDDEMLMAHTDDASKVSVRPPPAVCRGRSTMRHDPPAL